MAVSPESMPEKPLDFRAPPPSPIASGRRSSVTNDEVLTEFLEHSLRVPHLVLPDKVFPKQKVIDNPPRIDFELLNSQESDCLYKLLDSIASIGCFQLVNYGIPHELMASVAAAATGIFEVTPEKKVVLTRSPEKSYGFEEVHEERESEFSEEFVWCRDDRLKREMEGIRPTGYSNFSEKMETLMSDIEKVAERILSVLRENFPRKSKLYGNDEMMMEEEHEEDGTVCYIYKHRHKVISAEQWVRYDVMRMLIRGFDHSHALCLHLCDGSSEFHVYSKKDWLSFCPDKHALVVTLGDQFQAMSGGKYKQVIGRAIFKEDKEDCISMAFLYSPPPAIISNSNSQKGKTISLGQQAMGALLLTLLYHFLVYLFKKF